MEAISGLAIAGLVVWVAFMYAKNSSLKDDVASLTDKARRLATLNELKHRQTKAAYEKIVKHIHDSGLADELARVVRKPNGKL